MKATAALLLSIILFAGCGDAQFAVVFRSGTVVTEPDCRDGRGDFDFRDESGLVLVVVIDDDTVILLANGLPGGCDDISRGANADVSGPTKGMRLTADEVRLR